jgi:hypothetical protein
MHIAWSSVEDPSENTVKEKMFVLEGTKLRHSFDTPIVICVNPGIHTRVTCVLRAQVLKQVQFPIRS